MSQGWSAPSAAGEVVVEPVGGVLTLRSGAESRAELVALATELPMESGRTAVVSAPPVTGRPDFFDLLPDVLIEHLGGSAGGIRLIPLGEYAPSIDAEEAAQELAEWVGQTVLFPVSGLHLTPGQVGMPARSAKGHNAVAWVACTPGSPVRYAAPWPAPTEAPVAIRTPPIQQTSSSELTQPLAVKPARVRPTPSSEPTQPLAGAPRTSAAASSEVTQAVTVRPRPAPPAEAAPPAPAEGITAPPPSGADRVAAWPAGGVWRLVPVDAGGIAAVPRNRPPVVWSPPRPQARPARPAVPAADRELSVPGVRTPAGWSFLDEPAIGTGPALAGFVVEVRVDLTGFRVGGRPLPPRSLARLIAARRPDARQPVVLVVRGATVGGTAADLLYGALADALAVAVYAADADVHRTATGLLRTTGTFRRWNPRTGRGEGRPARQIRVIGNVLPPLPVRPAQRTRPAEAIRPVAEPRRPVEEAPEPAVLGPEVAALLAPERWLRRSGMAPVEAPALPEPVAALRTARVMGVAKVPPADDAPRRIESPVAVTYPQVDRPAVASSPAAVAEDADVEPPVAGTHPAVSGPQSAPAAMAAVSEPEPDRPSPRWLVDADLAEAVADRGILRQALAGRYDAHARVVSRTLAESPGLRAAAGAVADLTAGLVAVCAYYDGRRDEMNEVLRGSGPEDGVETAMLLARSATYGVRRLPTVLGPVFRSGSASPGQIAAYRPGEVLIEPAFIDVNLTAGPAPESDVEYVIWSVSARRLDGLAQNHPGRAIFQPGNRFQVLTVDDPEPGGGPARVYLRDLAAARRGGRDSIERILSQLRAVPRAGSGPGSQHAVPLNFAPGLDASGRPFRPPAENADGVAANENGQA